MFCKVFTSICLLSVNAKHTVKMQFKIKLKNRNYASRFYLHPNMYKVTAYYMSLLIISYKKYTVCVKHIVCRLPYIFWRLSPRSDIYLLAPPICLSQIRISSPIPTINLKMYTGSAIFLIHVVWMISLTLVSICKKVTCEMKECLLF